MAVMLFENNEWKLSDTWSIDDVRVAIEREGIEEAEGFTDADCVKVLRLVIKAFDANIGINWESISAAVQMVAKTKGERK